MFLLCINGIVHIIRHVSLFSVCRQYKKCLLVFSCDLNNTLNNVNIICPLVHGAQRRGKNSRHTNIACWRKDVTFLQKSLKLTKKPFLPLEQSETWFCFTPVLSDSQERTMIQVSKTRRLPVWVQKKIGTLESKLFIYIHIYIKHL